MTYSNLEKLAIVFSLMGSDQAQVILNKLPKELVEKVQEQVVPLINSVRYPDDIDGFVLEHIIQSPVEEKPVPDTTETPEDSKPEEDVVDSQETLPEPDVEQEPAVLDWKSIPEDELLGACEPSTVIRCLEQENKAFQPFLLSIFSQDKQELIRAGLKEKGIELSASFKATPMIEKIGLKLRTTFVENVRLECVIEASLMQEDLNNE